MPLIVIGIIKRFGGYALGALVVLAAYLWAHHAIYQDGYKEGAQKVQAAWDADEAKRATQAAKAATSAKADSDSNSRVAVEAAVKQGNDQQKVDANFNVIEQQVKTYAKNHPPIANASSSAAAVCDAECLRIWNAANAGSADSAAGAAGNNPQQSAAGMP